MKVIDSPIPTSGYQSVSRDGKIIKETIPKIQKSVLLEPSDTSFEEFAEKARQAGAVTNDRDHAGETFWVTFPDFPTAVRDLSEKSLRRFMEKRKPVQKEECTA